ncbi:MAG: hypothetical protein FJ267_10845, partial [Planctomycetes bacterium]|nr:hypothetical protein [Planctomycetota bacterium]
MTFCISSLSRAMAACDLIFDSVDRSDLAESMEDRLKDYRAFSGIDRKHPLGIIWTWDESEPAAIVYLPIGKFDELMKTATFDVVGFHKVNDDHYEIERPGSPYHVVLRSDYALFGDSVAGIKAISQSPAQITRPLSDKYDAAFL